MTRKELLFAALRNGEVERTPWVPFAGCHAAKLIGVTADEYFRSADHIFNGIMKAYEKYRPDGLPALFDLQVEAEALGCELRYSADNPPSVVSHPLASDPDVSRLKVPSASDGRIPVVLEATRRITSALGDKIGIYGLITGPFTLALHLRGTDVFFDLLDNPEYVHELMAFCTKVGKAMAQMYIDAGVDVVANVDPMTSQISADAFREFVRPYATEIFDFVRSKGKFTSYFVCGNAKNNIEEMCLCRPDNISIDENVPLDYVRDVCQRHGISFGGNIKLTISILFGTPADNMSDAMNCMHVGGKKGFILSPGCDIPFAAPEENLQAIAAVVHGDVVEFESSSDVLEDVKVEVPDYSDPSTVYVDVFTVDSLSCAPCQYMVEAVKRTAEGLGCNIVWKEHKIKEKESVVLMKKLGVQNIPTTLIDGQIKFISRIPDDASLRKEITDALARKQQR